MKYDDASWHYGGNFPSDLAPEAGATHIGMFVAWMVINDLASADHDEAELLLNRDATPGAYFLRFCDGKFTDEDLTSEGQAFTKFYFDLEKGSYLCDYCSLLSDSEPTPYHLPDNWATFDALDPLISRRFKEWKQNDA